MFTYEAMYRLRRQYCELCYKNVTLPQIGRYKRRHLAGQADDVTTELAAGYKPHEVERTPIEEQYFLPEAPSIEPPFTLILPPPNITGTLHLGHALTAFVQDTLVKWHRMLGRQTVWVPGLDHAGIATQVVVEKKLFKEKSLTRKHLGREAFEGEIWKWTREKSSTIMQQLKRLNINLDWDKEVFTMDEARSEAVVEAFIRLFEQGLIYRADHLINWSCSLQSAISDIEVDHLELQGPTELFIPGYEQSIKFGTLIKFAYKLVDNPNGEVVVATTRPETILGDVAVAVNPKDSRYTHLIGQFLHHPFRNDTIPIVGDEFVDPSFGTGAVKITPAHDPVDFEAGKRHNLKPLTVIDGKGLLTNTCGAFEGVKRFDAREAIISQLMQKNLYRGHENHKMVVPICSRSKDVVEFIIKPQWFLECSEMAKKAVADVKEGRLRIEPVNFEKVWFQWLENIRPWCISRQLWWGHRLPVYSCQVKGSEKSIWVGGKSHDEALKKGAVALNCDPSQVECIQEEDVLDTWFSSGLQPFSVFGWPKKTKELQMNYPLSIMETGYDILFFWVARMVMLGTHLTGRLPFDHILLHGIICDAHGRKMSKSLGNVIAPEEIIEGRSVEQLNNVLKQGFEQGILSEDELTKASRGQQKMFPNGIPECGADALRFTLLSHNVKNHVINFDVNECYTNKLFGNKIWQATRFTLLWIGNVSREQNPGFFHGNVTNFEEFAPMDRWVLSKLTLMLQTANEGMEKRDFHLATGALKEFLYFEFCDVYLESVKSNLKNRSAEPSSKIHCWTLLTCLDYSLRALAPFMPALSRHLHERLPRLWNVGSDRAFPIRFTDRRDHELERDVLEINHLVTGIRRMKKIFNLTFKHKPEVFLVPEREDTARKFHEVIRDLANLHSLHILGKNQSKPDDVVEDHVGRNRVFLVVPEELKRNLEVDKDKMEVKKAKLLEELAKINAMVNRSEYKLRTSAEAQETHSKKIAQITEKISRIDYIQNLIK